MKRKGLQNKQKSTKKLTGSSLWANFLLNREAVNFLYFYCLFIFHYLELSLNDFQSKNSGFKNTTLNLFDFIVHNQTFERLVKKELSKNTQKGVFRWGDIINGSF